jgi:hypothetical protein
MLRNLVRVSLHSFERASSLLFGFTGFGILRRGDRVSVIRIADADKLGTPEKGRSVAAQLVSAIETR